MPSAAHRVVIDRPIEVVFAFLTDPANDRRWRIHVVAIDAEGEPGVGRRIRQTIPGPGGRGIPADIEVTEYVPPTVYAFAVVAGPVRPVGRFRLRPVDGGTEVELSLAAELTGIKRLILSKAVQSSMDAEVAGLDTVKALLES
jgi:uncharacterized protein YndB with AHSA1/START domain